MRSKEEIKDEIRELTSHISENKDLLIRAYKDRDEIWIEALKEGISRQVQTLEELQDQFKVLTKTRPWFPPLVRNDDWESVVQDAFEDEEDDEFLENEDLTPVIGLLPRGNPIPTPITERKCECGAHAIGFADAGPWHNAKCPMWEVK